MAWDGAERRKSDYVHQENRERLENLKEQVAILTHKLDSLKQRSDEIHDELVNEISSHKKILYGNGGNGLATSMSLTVSNLAMIKKELENHTVQDRWVQGSILTIILAILGKLFGLIR